MKTFENDSTTGIRVINTLSNSQHSVPTYVGIESKFFSPRLRVSVFSVLSFMR